MLSAFLTTTSGGGRPRVDCNRTVGGNASISGNASIASIAGNSGNSAFALIAGVSSIARNGGKLPIAATAPLCDAWPSLAQRNVLRVDSRGDATRRCDGGFRKGL